MDWLSIINNAAGELISPTTAAYALAAIGLSVHFGYAGLLNFGQAGFMAVGAYAFAIATLSFSAPVWLAILVAIVASVLFAFLLGIPTLRLRADYLAIVTIAAAEIVRYVVSTVGLTNVTGGSQGLNGYNREFQAMNPLPAGTYGIGPWTYSANDWWVRIFGWGLVIIATLLVYVLMRSPWGRVVKGIREDEDAVRSLGKNVYSYKMQALVLGALMGSLAGIIYVLPSSVQPDSMGRSMTFFIWTALLLGGAATVFGPVLGAILFFVTRLLVRTLAGDFIPSNIMNGQQAEQFSYILVGIALMLLIIFRPQGILGKKKELAFSV